MKTVIVGANGTIGRALRTALPDCVGLTSKAAPGLTTVKYEWPTLRPNLSGADAIIYCIGISKFAECEQEPEKAMHLNVGLPHDILRQLSNKQIFVYFSSPIALHNFAPAKTPIYAQQKRLAEEGLQQDNVIIVRPSKVIESAGIIRDWKTALSQKKNITAFSDQSLSPVNTALLAEQLLRLMRKQCSGAYNFSASDRLSYLELAKNLCTYFNLDAGLIEPQKARDNNPFFFEQDVLDCFAASKATGYAPPASRDIVNEYFRTLA